MSLPTTSKSPGKFGVTGIRGHLRSVIRCSTQVHTHTYRNPPTLPRSPICLQHPHLPTMASMMMVDHKAPTLAAAAPPQPAPVRNKGLVVLAAAETVAIERDRSCALRGWIRNILIALGVEEAALQALTDGNDARAQVLSKRTTNDTLAAQWMKENNALVSQVDHLRNVYGADAVAIGGRAPHLCPGGHLLGQRGEAEVCLTCRVYAGGAHPTRCSHPLCLECFQLL